MFNKVIRHYGTKGMRWGVRKAARTFLTGNPKTSLLHPKGRKSAAAEGKKAVNKLLNNKVFKATIYNHANAKKMAKMGKQQVTDLIGLVKKDK